MGRRWARGSGFSVPDAGLSRRRTPLTDSENTSRLNRSSVFGPFALPPPDNPPQPSYEPSGIAASPYQRLGQILLTGPSELRYFPCAANFAGRTGGGGGCRAGPLGSVAGRCDLRALAQTPGRGTDSTCDLKELTVTVLW
jgi:hypothetical protein